MQEGWVVMTDEWIAGLWPGEVWEYRWGAGTGQGQTLCMRNRAAQGEEIEVGEKGEEVGMVSSKGTGIRIGEMILSLLPPPQHLRLLLQVVAEETE